MADIELVIKIPEDTYKRIQALARDDYFEHDICGNSMRRIANGTPLPKGHGRLIDADICLNEAWQNFYKQEDEHEKNIGGYDIMRDRFYEQSGFECCQQTIVNAPTVEAIPKADYENRLKDDKVAMLTELQAEIEELDLKDSVPDYRKGAEETREYIANLIQQKIDALKGDKQ